MFVLAVDLDFDVLSTFMQLYGGAHMYFIGIIMALCFLLSGALAGCTTSPLRIASPDIVVEIDGKDASLEAGRRGSGLRAGRSGSGLRAGRYGSGLRR